MLSGFNEAITVAEGMETKLDLAAEIRKRHPSIGFILSWLEAGEDWVVPENIMQDALAPLAPLMKRPPPPVDHEDARLAAEVITGINASDALAIIDWLDGHPDTDIGALFVDNEDLPLPFRNRLTHMLLILLRGELLSVFFSPEHRQWLEDCLLRDQVS